MTLICVWSRRCTAVGLSVGALLYVMVGTSLAQQQDVAEAGKTSYRHYCAVCHGLNGKGHGDMATLLKVKPANLTRLSTKHDGIFPFWDVYRSIDGRKEIGGHGPRGMPIWGTVLKEEAGADIGANLQAYARILKIVYYIESLQATVP